MCVCVKKNQMKLVAMVRVKRTDKYGAWKPAMLLLFCLLVAKKRFFTACHQFVLGHQLVGHHQTYS